MAKSKLIKVTLKKSIAGRIPAHRATVRGLGLSRINQTVELQDNPAIRGMITQVSYLLQIHE